MQIKKIRYYNEKYIFKVHKKKNLYYNIMICKLMERISFLTQIRTLLYTRLQFTYQWAVLADLI